MDAYIKLAAEIHLDGVRSQREAVFDIDVPTEDRQIKVHVDLAALTIEALHVFPVTQEFWKPLLSTGPARPEKTEVVMDDVSRAELGKQSSLVRNAAKKVVWGLKYYLNWSAIHEILIRRGKTSISPDGKMWTELNFLPYHATVKTLNHTVLDDLGLPALAAFVQKSEPFFDVSLRHLHRAQKDENPRHAWIDATVAAELAIKEFLIIRYPAFATFLLEVPSPPLHKLYGSVLKSLVGEESPKKKEIANGVTVRNNLIHRPTAEEIDWQTLNDYVDDVEIAIYHLLHLLRPDDDIIRRLLLHRGSSSAAK